MIAFNRPHTFIPAFAPPAFTAIAFATMMTAAFSGPASADETSVVDITIEETASQDSAQLRRLLTNATLNVKQQDRLERALDDVYEEHADASGPRVPNDFIQSVNDLLGVKSPPTQHAQG